MNRLIIYTLIALLSGSSQTLPYNKVISCYDDGVFEVKDIPVVFVDRGKSDEIILSKNGRDSLTFHSALSFKLDTFEFCIPILNNIEETYRFCVSPEDSLLVNIVIIDTSRCKECKSYSLFDYESIRHVGICAFISKIILKKQCNPHVDLYDGISFDDRDYYVKKNIPIIFAEWRMNYLYNIENERQLENIMVFYYQDSINCYRIPYNKTILPIEKHYSYGDELFIDISINKMAKKHIQDSHPYDYSSTIIGIRKKHE